MKKIELNANMKSIELGEIKIVYIEAFLMPNGEIVSYGKSLGFISDRQMELIEVGATKMSKPHIPCVAINGQTA